MSWQKKRITKLEGSFEEIMQSEEQRKKERNEEAHRNKRH